VARPLGRGHSWPPKNKPSHYVKFGRSAWKNVRINRREPRTFVSDGARPLWRADPLEIRPPRVNGVILLNLVVLGQRTRTLLLSYGDPPGKFDSFLVIPDHRNRHGSIGDLWLPISVHSMHGPITFRFWNKRPFQSIIEIFPPDVFSAPLRRSPWNWVMVFGLKKISIFLNRPRNELYCVEWDVKLHYTIPSSFLKPKHHYPIGR